MVEISNGIDVEDRTCQWSSDRRLHQDESGVLCTVCGVRNQEYYVAWEKKGLRSKYHNLCHGCAVKVGVEW
jgi:Pyruvate/2-oxoacid:ferredoxin oxidoreductase delta subunit